MRNITIVANLTVFVVDDDAGAMMSLKWLLESDGLKVETYSSAQDFLDAYDPSHPGCLVVDLHMPKMDGLQLQQELATNGWQLPVVFVTGHGEIPKYAEAMRAGAFGFLEKPADDKKLLPLIHQALDSLRR